MRLTYPGPWDPELVLLEKGLCSVRFHKALCNVPLLFLPPSMARLSRSPVCILVRGGGRTNLSVQGRLPRLHHIVKMYQ